MDDVVVGAKPDPRAKEIRFIAKVKNNRLLEIREKMGLSQVKFAAFIGVSYV